MPGHYRAIHHKSVPQSVPNGLFTLYTVHTVHRSHCAPFMESTASGKHKNMAFPTEGMLASHYMDGLVDGTPLAGPWRQRPAYQLLERAELQGDKEPWVASVSSVLAPDPCRLGCDVMWHLRQLVRRRCSTVH